MTTNRWIAGNMPSRSAPMDSAMIGIANETPTNMATSTLGARPHERVSWNRVSTIATALAAMAQRMAIQVA